MNTNEYTMARWNKSIITHKVKIDKYVLMVDMVDKNNIEQNNLKNKQEYQVKEEQIYIHIQFYYNTILVLSNKYEEILNQNRVN